MKIPGKIIEHSEEYTEKIRKYSPKLAEMYKKCYVNTIETALEPMDDGSIFVLTGDIPAMWLRDSTAEVSHYIPVAKNDSETADIIKGVIKKQQFYIKLDPYTNAFKKEPNDFRPFDDYPLNGPWIWERKYEVDSLCYPLRLVYLYWKATGDDSVLDSEFLECAEITVDQWILEQRHFENSSYMFKRNCDDEKEFLGEDGRGNPVEYTGMTWSGFRPSDDACRYGYLVASNMFAYVVLGYLDEILSYLGENDILLGKCRKLRYDIYKGIDEFAVVENNGKRIFACEVDGRGNDFRFDDANVPSLLSAPYLGFCSMHDEIYQNTREFILSSENPYYYSGKFGKGVGSPHTPAGYIWHIALSMQGLTTDNNDEIREVLSILENSDSGTLLMHEGFNADNPDEFTRSWFSWSCSLFSELCEYAVDKGAI